MQTFVSSWPCAIINCRSESYWCDARVDARCGGNQTLRHLIGLVSLTTGVWYNQSGTFAQRLPDRMRRGLVLVHSARHVMRHAWHMEKRDTSLSYRFPSAFASFGPLAAALILPLSLSPMTAARGPRQCAVCWTAEAFLHDAANKINRSRQRMVASHDVNRPSGSPTALRRYTGQPGFS